MIFDEQLLERLLGEAALSSRHRQNFDLRTSSEDTSQRMLNAVLPGTQVPIHRHPHSTEVVFILKGCIDEILYNEQGKECGRYRLNANDEGARGCVVAAGAWHTIQVYEPSVIFEAKDGAFSPLLPEDILQ